MEALRASEAAQIILEAVKLTTDAEIALLHQLTNRNAGILTLDLTLRILLTFLPESTDPDLYTDFLHDILTSSSRDALSETVSYVSAISDSNTHYRVRKLHLLPLADPRQVYENITDSFTLFLLHRAHKIEAETGSLLLIQRLVDPFINHSEHLRTWAISTLLPLLRLYYDYYPHDGPFYSLENFEALVENSAIDSLLSEGARNSKEEVKSQVARDLRGLIGPWMYGANKRKRRILDTNRKPSSSIAQLQGEYVHEVNGWTHVNDWLVDLALRDFSMAVEALIQWNGPGDVDYGQWGGDIQQVAESKLQILTEQYAQTGLAAMYSTGGFSMETLKASHRVLQRVANLMDLQEPPGLILPHPLGTLELPPEYLSATSQSHLLHNSLLRPRNPFTTPTGLSVRLSYLLLESSFILEDLGYPSSCKTLAELSLFATGIEQRVELCRLLNCPKAKSRDQAQWNTAHKQIRWLQDWNYECDYPGQSTHPPSGVFGKVKRIGLEDEVLRALLNSGCYSLAASIYCQDLSQPIPAPRVEKTVVGVALACYDGASNGNRTRGGVRNASDIITAFRGYFPNSESFNQVLALIAATHAMSFYSLTLQHGVPFQPVNIRAHNDPISLLGKILNQNSHSYTKLDDLLEIGQNLVSAGLTNSIANENAEHPGEATPERRRTNTRRRVTAMAIESALAAEDFDTAFSYVVNRLSPLATSSLGPPESQDVGFITQDDISWRAAYQVGRYCHAQEKGCSALRRVEQRMELLCQALLLAPPFALSEILAVWRRCEDEISALIAREAKEEERWDDKGDRKVPGGFSEDSSPPSPKARVQNRAALVEEAPMGLFDVARGAAAALSKNAFPLRSSQDLGVAVPPTSSHKGVRGITSRCNSESRSLGEIDTQGRVRKRDMVSSMVTGGLASGIGWVIGAPSVRQE